MESFRKTGLAQKGSANGLGVSPSTAFREIKRNKNLDGYVATEA